MIWEEFVQNRRSLGLYLVLPHRLSKNFVKKIYGAKIYYTGDSSEGDLCDGLVSFFNIIHFKLLKIRRAVRRPASGTRKNFLIDLHELKLWESLKSVITEAFFHFHLKILFGTIPILLKWVS